VEWQSDFRGHERIRYVHVPGGNEVFVSKLQQGLAAIQTPYAAMCADDDFITAEGLARSIAFLDMHPDYSYCQGYAYFFQPFDARVVTWPMPYHDHDLHAEAWLDRVERASSPAIYGVNRIGPLRAVFEFIARQDFAEIVDNSDAFFHFAFDALIARQGKFNRCRVPFNLREYAPLSSGGARSFMTIVSHDVPDFHRNLAAELMQGSDSEAERERLLKLFARHYAMLILHDLSRGSSKKRFFRHWPEAWVRRVEFFYRLLHAIGVYAAWDCWPFLKIFFHPEYRRFRTMVIQRGAR
jgi:glycosyltransferase domain-containing protein